MMDSGSFINSQSIRWFESNALYDSTNIVYNYTYNTVLIHLFFKLCVYVVIIYYARYLGVEISIYCII